MQRHPPSATSCRRLSCELQQYPSISCLNEKFGCVFVDSPLGSRRVENVVERIPGNHGWSQHEENGGTTSRYHIQRAIECTGITWGRACGHLHGSEVYPGTPTYTYCGGACSTYHTSKIEIEIMHGSCSALCTTGKSEAIRPLSHYVEKQHEFTRGVVTHVSQSTLS